MPASFATIALIHLLGVLSPGPDVAVVIRNAIQFSRRSALFTAAGIACGIWVHICYCLLGLTFIIVNSDLAFTLIKILGAVFLGYMGIQQLRSSSQNSETNFQHAAKDLTPVAALWQGFLCNVLNPKASLYFLSLFTLVIKPDTQLNMKLLYGFEIFAITFGVFALMGLCIAQPAVKSRLARIQHIINKVMGLVLIVFAIRLLLSTR